MPSLVDKIITLKAKEFNKLREKLAPEDSYAWLLQKTGLTDEYLRLYILDNWYYKFNDFRGQTHVYVASTETAFVNALKIASDITINGYVYEIDKRDLIPPDGERAWWEFYCSKTIDTFTEDDLP